MKFFSKWEENFTASRPDYIGTGSGRKGNPYFLVLKNPKEFLAFLRDLSALAVPRCWFRPVPTSWQQSGLVRVR
jgi:hypothetical protein